MLPLSYAMLRHLICCDEACADDIMTALAGEYASFSAFTKPHVQEALMTAEKMASLRRATLIWMPRASCVFYCASLEQRKVISAYLG